MSMLRWIADCHRRKPTPRPGPRRLTMLRPTEQCPNNRAISEVNVRRRMQPIIVHPKDCAKSWGVAHIGYLARTHREWRIGDNPRFRWMSAPGTAGASWSWNRHPLPLRI